MSDHQRWLNHEAFLTGWNFAKRGLPAFEGVEADAAAGNDFCRAWLFGWGLCRAARKAGGRA